MSDHHPEALALVPMPRHVAVKAGHLSLGRQIVAATRELKPLAAVLAQEIHMLTGREMSVSEGNANPGDILLQLDKGLSGESYRLEVGESAAVRGGDYDAVALGTVTLLQAISVQDGVVRLPCMCVSDAPSASYRGLMVDVARKPHSIATLEQCIALCRWYKIRYLQLHFTDDEMFTFTSTAFPKLATPGKAYTLAELRGLEAYAQQRGVTIIPELDVPGHCGAIVNAMPELFAVEGGARKGWSVTMNFAREAACQAIETIIEEILDVFQSTPYFHIGADESDFAGFDQDPCFQEAYKQHGITGDLDVPDENRTTPDKPKLWIKPEEHPRAYALSLRFVSRLHDKIKRLGKQTLIWEGFSQAGSDKLPRDMIVMPYHMRNYPPEWLVQDGFTLINATSEHLYVVRGWPKPEARTLCEWNLHRFEWRDSAWKNVCLPASAPVLGAQMCSWEQPDEDELPSLRKLLTVFSERLWNVECNDAFDDRKRRLDITDAKLSALLGLSGVPKQVQAVE